MNAEKKVLDQVEHLEIIIVVFENITDTSMGGGTVV